jgi:hypothetical protein
MNEDNWYCGDYKCGKECDAIIVPCDACGKLCVFESNKQPAKGCPLHLDIVPKHEYDVCSVCDHRFCDDHSNGINCYECEERVINELGNCKN